MATVSHTSEHVWIIPVSIDHWLPSLRTASVGGSTHRSPALTAPNFNFVVRDCWTSTTNRNINIETKSMVSQRELTFLGSRSLLVYSLWLVHQPAWRNAILVFPTIKCLDQVFLRCPFALGSSGALADHFHYEKWCMGVGGERCEGGVKEVKEDWWRPL